MAERTAETPQTVVITGASAGIGRAAARVEAELGPIDVWVNVAFASVFAPFGDISPAEYRPVTEVSYLGFVHDRSGVRVTVVQMPAVNTPQFAWVRSRLSHQPQPVPPIYQPEIAAKAVVFAAGHPQRKLMAALTSGPTAAPSRSGCPSTSGSQSGQPRGPLLPQLRLCR